MSDVWQGPGWWLASDGKWYPADAEPGAVYEGDLQNNDAPAVDAAQPIAADVSIPAEPVPRLDVPAEPASPGPFPIAPAVAETPAPAVPPTPAPAFGADPFAEMPNPVVQESKVGGWQTIEPQAPVAPFEAVPTSLRVAEDPTAEAIGDDGWTSAYEERHEADVSGVVSAPMQPMPTAPPVDPLPQAQIPDVAPPTPVMPDAHMQPVETPEVQVPPAQIPDSQIQDLPDSQIQDLAAPVASAAAVAGVAAVAGRDPSVPIERDDAWRKPSAPDETLTRPIVAEPTGVPDVVDLAVIEEPPAYVPEPSQRNWTLVGGVVVAIAAIVGIALLVASLLSSGDDNADTSNPNSGATPSSEASAPSTEAEDDPTNVSVFELRAGDCIVGDIGAGQVTKVIKVDCKLEHQFEVYREALIDTSITSFNEEAISEYAEDVCRTSLEAYISADDDRGLKFKFLQPTEDSWNQVEDPDRVITCLLFDDDGPIIGTAA